jgi:hypothetical protein
MVPYVVGAMGSGVDTGASPGNQAANGAHQQIPLGRGDGDGKAWEHRFGPNVWWQPWATGGKEGEGLV